MIHVYLDDFRSCPKGFVLAKNVEECNMLIDDNAIDILSLDYDLGWGEPHGIEVVRHMIAMRRFPRSIYLHTSSVAGRIQMYDLLVKHIPETTKLYGGAMPSSILSHVAANG
ncbi:cyclic-phosphate processing receiver domain-containing protein [Paenibacillus yanchengensis]|uniref:Cyclic-phosphate processing receiver domain-containing protein n=1 Tax=Paenibacillus yanchengensis TaxID=2035833 RepID=A0ABW4YQ20_9BACL